jgi:biopolymer transport protein ExbD
MSWKVRHEGSPQWVEAPSLEAVLEGMQDGQWETSDEVMGPGETVWTPIESHPLLADAAAELEPAPPRLHEDEARLDMNAIIDVTLVLLIFFILTATYIAFQTKLDTPNLQAGEVGKEISQADVDTKMIHVKVTLENGKPVTRVGEEVVAPEKLEAKLASLVSQTHRTILLLESERKVPTGAVVAVQDAARGANMERVYRLIQPTK